MTDSNKITRLVLHNEICRVCGEELRLGHKQIGVCSFCISSKSKPKFPQVGYGVKRG